MLFNEKKFGKLLRLTEILYMVMFIFSAYFLVVSRTGEARTVWDVLHPLFIPTFCVVTILLLTIIFSSEKTAYKLTFVMIHSILIHSLFSIIFPAGDTSGQQMYLGRIRFAFDNTAIQGWLHKPAESIQSVILQLFKGTNFQAALSVTLARMFSIDIFYVHLFLVPVLWGAFIPIASFLVTRAFSGDEKIAVLSSLLISAFPYTIYFGAISVPNSLGFIFFYYSIYFMLKYLSSKVSKTLYWISVFSFLSFLSHPLTGVMSASFLLLTATLQIYESEKSSSPMTAKVSLAASTVLSASVLPLSFIYRRLFVHTAYTVFTLDRLYEFPIEEIIGLMLIGELIYGFNIKTIILVFLGPLLALLCMIFLLFRLERNPPRLQKCILFLSLGFIILLIDYRILKVFMDGLPINEERLWVIRDFMAVPFASLLICKILSSVKTFSNATFLSTKFPTNLRERSARKFLFIFSVSLNVLVPILLGGWITYSLSVAYPRVAPLQTTWYELEAVRYIEENTHEKYVVIGDIWTIYAGEMIVGIYNPQAYYFGENDVRGHNLFIKMLEEPSTQVMMEAMNQTGTDTTIAYFVITEPRVGTEKFNDTISRIFQEKQLTEFWKSDNGKLYVFSYKKK
jgi:hypothetical protein